MFVGQSRSPCPQVGIPTGPMYCRAICLEDSLSFPLLTLLLPQLLPFRFLWQLLHREQRVLTTDYSNPQLEINTLLRGKATRNERGVASELKGQAIVL